MRAPLTTTALPSSVPELQQMIFDLIASNRHLVQQNGKLVTESNTLATALGQIITVYRSEDGQALLDMLAHYAAVADAHIALDKAAHSSRSTH